MANNNEPYRQLTQADVDHFLQHGWIKIPNCFTQSQVDSLTSNLWTRLGMSPTDKSTWHAPEAVAGRLNLPHHNTFLADSFAPKAWNAICDLLGGEDRVSHEKREWNDGFIINFGTEEGEGEVVRGQDLPGWHVDGDFFVHYLDSPEQGLLVIPLFTPIRPGGGGTVICPPAIDVVAKYLRDHPEGVSPYMRSRGTDPAMEGEKSLQWFCDVAKSMPDEAFVEATGDVGDVYLLHPLMLHSASNNSLRELRIITNPPVSLKEPFEFNRSGGEGYSVVERKTLAALGGEKAMKGWKISEERQRIVPERVKRQQRMREEELRRLEELKAKGSVEMGQETKANAVAAG